MARKPSASEDAILGNNSDDDIATQESKILVQVGLLPLSETAVHAWNDVNEKQLRSAFTGACKQCRVMLTPTFTSVLCTCASVTEKILCGYFNIASKYIMSALSSTTLKTKIPNI